MAAIGVFLNGEQCWPEIAKRKQIDLMGPDAPPIHLALIPGGLTNGDSAITLRVDLPDGQVVLTQMSVPRFLEAAKALQLAEAAFRRRLRDPLRSR